MKAGRWRSYSAGWRAPRLRRARGALPGPGPVHEAQPGPERTGPSGGPAPPAWVLLCFLPHSTRSRPNPRFFLFPSLGRPADPPPRSPEKLPSFLLVLLLILLSSIPRQSRVQSGKKQGERQSKSRAHRMDLCVPGFFQFFLCNSP